MITAIEQWLEQLSTLTTIYLAVLALVAIGIVDRLAPTEAAFLLFYLVPIFFITWRFDNPWGYVAGLGSVIVWGLSEYLGSSTHIWVAVWNLLVAFGLFFTYAALIGSLRETLLNQRTLNRKLEEALAEVKTLSGLLPICAWCKRIRDEDGHWHQMEEYIHAHADVSITHGICPDCKAKARR